ncbi:unnamed protein product [Symbiodinium necroappetens]|uniref:Uncharacterized protein n=1 Tax=Symbiodinium necroappetens TaxID=1628268 RepID=A0A812U0C2_9DINO|nr:unnamed protein product [Symbiodinium necroappetens]
MSSGNASDGGISRNKDGVPQWSGDPATFQQYEEEARLWEQTQAWHKRHMAAPRLKAELQGAARRLILGQPAEWTAHEGGVSELLQFLRARLGKAQMPELSEWLTRYFRSTKRKAQETVGEYITRTSLDTTPEDGQNGAAPQAAAPTATDGDGEMDGDPQDVVTSAAISVIKFETLSNQPLRYIRTNMPGLSSMNKVQLVAEIHRLGGTADVSARKLELQQQLYGLYEDHGVSTGPNRATTDYQNYTRAMNKAGKYKKDLIKYMEEHLNLSVNYNATQIQLQKQALLKIYALSKIDETDPVGFGIHSSLSYRELKETQPQYCQWARATANEGQCNPLMTRLVRWLVEDQASGSLSGHPIGPKAKAKSTSTAIHGRRDVGDTDVQSTGSLNTDMTQETVMREMMGALRNLQAEVGALKEEQRSSRPRRENHPDEEMETKSVNEDGSFVAVSGPTKK